MIPGEQEETSVVDPSATLPARTRITPFGKALILGCAGSILAWVGIGWLLARYVL